MTKQELKELAELLAENGLEITPKGEPDKVKKAAYKSTLAAPAPVKAQPKHSKAALYGTVVTIPKDIAGTVAAREAELEAAIPGITDRKISAARVKHIGRNIGNPKEDEYDVKFMRAVPYTWIETPGGDTPICGMPKSQWKPKLKALGYGFSGGKNMAWMCDSWGKHPYRNHGEQKGTGRAGFNSEDGQ